MVFVIVGAYFGFGTLSANKASPPVSVTPKDTVVSLGQNETSCGIRFFSKTQLALMRKQFGSISCIGLISTHQWILVGDGMQTNPASIPPPPTAGGAMVAIETCSATDAACKSPISQHDFGRFTVSYPPYPSAGRMDLQTIDASKILTVTDCGSFSFDLKNMKWYVTQPGVDSALIAGNQSLKPVQTAAPKSGASALRSSAPVSKLGSCPSA